MNPSATTLLPIPFLLWALLPTNPYAYYTFLRVVCCGCFGYTALRHHEQRLDPWAFAFAALAVIYNPILPVHLDRVFWSIVNIGTIVFLMIAFTKLRQ